MKDFTKVIQPRFDYPEDPELEKAVNRVLDELTRRTNDAIAALVNKIPREYPLWAEGEEVTIVLNSLYDNEDKEVAVRHNLGVKPTRYLILDATIQTLKADNEKPITGLQRHELVRSDTTWTNEFAYFYPTDDAADRNTKFTVLLLP